MQMKTATFILLTGLFSWAIFFPTQIQAKTKERKKAKISKIESIIQIDASIIESDIKDDDNLSADSVLAQILCPTCDNDSDGIINLYDACVDIYGISEKYGCPQNYNFSRPEIIGISFATGKSDIPNSSFFYLYPFLKKLKEDPKAKIIIFGYTDNTGEYKDNITVSQRRADAVKNYFISKGINSSRITAIGFGPNNPIADNRTGKGQKANRRIEIYWE